MKNLSLIIIVIICYGCKNQNSGMLTAQSIIDNSIDVSGGHLIDSSVIDFDFRDKHYKAVRKGGTFRLQREFKDWTSDTVSYIKDVLKNDGFQRFVDDKRIKVSDSMVPKYSASVNSVHYFSVLPYGLNDKAVNKSRLEDVTIKSIPYHVIKVTFNQDGGGEDFEDEFIYWINSETQKIDYLAYSYDESDGKGVRFRAAYNERLVNGIRFVDYNNYKPETNITDLISLPHLFEKEQLKLLSKIALENVSVELIDR